MATYKTKRGTTSLLIDIWIGDSSSTTGAGKTGLVYNSAGLVCKLQESDTASATTVSLASATEGTFTSGGFVESALGNGWYQLGIPNANIDSGTKTKGILYGATNMVPTPFVIELDSIDYQDSVRAGLTALPNAAAEASGGLVTRGTGTGQMSVSSGQVIIQSGTGAGQIKFSSGYVAIDWGDIANKTTTNALTGTTIATTQKVDVETIKTNPVVNAGTITFPTGATLASTTNITAGTITTTTNLTNAPPDSSGVTTLLSRIGGSITISGGRVEANVTYFGGAPGVFTVAGLPDVNTSHYGGVDVSLVNVPCDVQTIKTQTVTCAAGVTIGPYVGNATAAITVDGSGYVTITNTIPTVGAIADGVWDELKADHTTPNTFGDYLDTEVSGVGGGGGGATAADIWDYATSSATTAGSMGKLIVDNLDAAITTRLATAGYTAPLDAAGTRTAVGLASANLDTQFANTYNIVSSGTFGNQAIKTAIDALSPVSATAGAFTQTYGSVISGTYANTATDDNTRHVTAPQAVNGLDEYYTFTISTSNKPTKLAINGYFNGTAQYAEVYAYDYDAAAWSQVSNSTNRMATRSSDTDYSYTLSRQHVEASTGEVKIRFVSPSTNTAHRLHLDRILVYSITEAGSIAFPTAENIRVEIDTNSTKTGYKLASDGLDSISTTAPSGVASTFREMLVQTWRRFFKKTVYSDSGNTIITYADDGTTVITTQSATSASGIETQGPAT